MGAPMFLELVVDGSLVAGNQGDPGRTAAKTPILNIVEIPALLCFLHLYALCGFFAYCGFLGDSLRNIFSGYTVE